MTERTERWHNLSAAMELGIISIEDFNRQMVALLASEVAEAVEDSQSRGTVPVAEPLNDRYPMRTYRLRLTLKNSELILDYRERSTEEWASAMGCVFVVPAQAQNEFAALRALVPPAYGVMEAFKDWNCVIPVALLRESPVLVMSKRDFIEM